MNHIARPLLGLIVVGIVFIKPVLAQQGYRSPYGSIPSSPGVEPDVRELRREHARSTARAWRVPSDSSSEESYNRWARRLAIVQGSYYVTTGLWPIIHMQSFEKITGPKTDDWLVKTVGGLITVVGGTLLISGLRNGPSRDLAAVALGSAATLAAVDIIYAAQDRIPSIYLVDAAGETILMAGWAITLTK